MAMILKYNYPGNTATYDIATCTDGKWHLAIHGTDRVLEYNCELCENACGQYLRYGSGSIIPLTDRNGKMYARWSEVSDNDNINVNDNGNVKAEPLTLNPEPLTITPEPLTEPQVSSFRFHVSSPLTLTPEPLTLNPEPLTIIEEVVTAPLPHVPARPKRQRRKKTQAAEDNNSSLFTLHSSFDEDNLPRNSEENKSCNDQNILKAVGMMAAMSVGLVVIWKTGLLIPVGILGLISSGLLK